MQQLLKITTTPIEYKIQLDNASLKVKQNEPVQMKSRTVPAKMDIQMDNIKVQLDTTKAQESLGFRSAKGLVRDAFQKGAQAAQDATAQYAAIGNQMAQIHTGQDIPAIMAQVTFRQPTTGMVFLPSTGPEISWDPASISMQYKPAVVQTDWQAAKFNMEYVPFKYQMNILQYPKVTIEYLGGPNYVPPSADPGYIEE